MEKITHIESTDNVHPNVQIVTAKRKRVREEVEAVDAERQVQVRSSIDLYLQMAKEMRLRRRINVKEAVDAEIQVQVRSGIDLYLQMAKEMRLRRSSNVK